MNGPAFEQWRKAGALAGVQRLLGVVDEGEEIAVGGVAVAEALTDVAQRAELVAVAQEHFGGIDGAGAEKYVFGVNRDRLGGVAEVAVFHAITFSLHGGDAVDDARGAHCERRIYA